MKKCLRDYVVIGIIFSIILSSLFYDTIIVSPLFFIVALGIYPKYFENQRSIWRENNRAMFKDALYAISGSVAAGRQMPTAIEDAAEQCALFDSNSDISLMLSEISLLYHDTNAEIDELLFDFAKKLEIDEIELFALSYRVCKECGGNLESVCLKNAALIIERLEYQKEVSATLSEKKLDIIILLIMPTLILFLLNIGSKEFLVPLYTTKTGREVMTLSLMLIVTACLWSLKIMKLEI